MVNFEWSVPLRNPKPKCNKPVIVVNCSYISCGKLKRRANRLHVCARFPLTSTSSLSC